MTFFARTISTRLAKPSHVPWMPHEYQRKAVQFLIERGAAALFLDPGLGKTSIVLDAFRRLKASGVAKRALVIAPLRVCQTVWRQEGQKWTDFRELRFSLLHGAKKAERLRDDADVWLINPEGVAWLCEQYRGRTLPFDTVVVDELTKFKNHAAERHKALRPRLRGVARRWGLTGTPAPNGMMDLFGQFLLLDDGAALEKYITHFRDKYFQVDYNGFDYVLLPGAERRIEARIAPYVLRMGAEDYLELPPIVDDVHELELDAKSRATYAKMKRDMLAELPEGVVTGANAAAAYSKLKQMANGAVYQNDYNRTVSKLHDIKLEALDDLVEELAGQQLLLAYEFDHDRVRLKEHCGDRLTVLESGLGEAKTAAIVAAWNAGTLPMLACHPASAAHGLNLQQSSCAHVCWFSPIWDLELYQQFIRRIRRQGNEAQRIVNHILCVKDSIDELSLAALRDKDTTQSRLLASLRHELTGEKETKEMSQVAKLSRPGDAAQPRIVPKGWGRPPTAAPTEAVTEVKAPADDIAAQRERIGAKLEGRGAPLVETDEMSPAEKARAAFSPAVRAALEGANNPEAYGAPSPTTPPVEKPEPPKRPRAKAPEAVPFGVVTVEHRLAALSFAVHSLGCTTAADAIEAATEIVEFLSAP